MSWNNLVLCCFLEEKKLMALTFVDLFFFQIVAESPNVLQYFLEGTSPRCVERKKFMIDNLSLRPRAPRSLHFNPVKRGKLCWVSY